MPVGYELSGEPCISTSVRGCNLGKCRYLIAVVLVGSSCRETSAPSVPEWRLTETVLQIRATQGPEAEFNQVAGAVRLANGEIAVADGGSNQVRYFSPTGAFLRSFGRQGAGPGEFQSMGRLIGFNDTLAVHDIRNGRLTLFQGDSLLRNFTPRISNSTARFSIHDRLADGRWLASTSITPRFSPRPYRDSIAVGIFPASGEGDIHLLGWFSGPWIVSLEGQATGLAGFFRWVSSRIAGREILVIDADQEQLRRFAQDGTELPSAAIPVQGRPLSPDLIDRVKRSEAGHGSSSNERQKWLDLRYDPAVLPSRLPFRDLIVDSEALAWLEDYREDQAPGKYYVLLQDARLVAVVTVPSGFRAIDIGLDYCLGVETDIDGVESIVMYRLARNY